MGIQKKSVASMDIHSYLKSSLEEKSALIQKIIQSHSELTYLEFTKSKIELPLFYHATLMQSFIYIPTGTFNFGLTSADVNKIEHIDKHSPVCYEEMQPTSSVQICNFLISEKPVLDSQYNPQIVEYNCAAEFAEYHKCKLPSEKQWEYSCRAGEENIFPFGNTVPNEIELEEWFSWNCKNSSKQNAFGLKNMFFGEFCEDDYHSSHSHISPTNGHVVKGGAAYFWPWQDNEWIWCLTTMRCSSKELPDEKAAYRLVIEL